MTKKYRIQNLGIKFLYAGIICLAISFLINAIYIRNTNFKAQYNQKQYESCLKKYTVDSCDNNYTH